MGTPGEPLRYGDPGLCYDDPRWHWDGVYPANNTNMDNNKVSAVLAAQAVTEILAAVSTIRSRMPFLLSLTEQQRHDLPKMGAQSQAVVEQALIFASQNPNALPANFNAVEFAKDGALLTPLQTVAQAISSLDEDTQDTLLALSNDLFVAFLDVYAFAKANNRSGNYDTFVNLVKVRFAKTKKATTPVTPTP